MRPRDADGDVGTQGDRRGKSPRESRRCQGRGCRVVPRNFLHSRPRPRSNGEAGRTETNRAVLVLVLAWVTPYARIPPEMRQRIVRLWQRLLDVLDDIFNRPTPPLDPPFAM